MAPQKPVGVIGVGLMGEVYARRLVAAGFAVIGYDVDQANNERLAGFGAKAGSLAEIATTCEPIVLAVFNTDQVEDVVEHTLVSAAAGIPLDLMQRLVISPCSISAILFTAGGPMVLCVNSTGTLEDLVVS